MTSPDDMHCSRKSSVSSSSVGKHNYNFILTST